MSNQWWEEYPRPSWLVIFWAIHKLQDELACLRSELSRLGAAIKANGE
jgi:hypothetical protein